MEEKCEKCLRESASVFQLNLIEHHYFGMSSQGNVYSLVAVHGLSTCKILISSLRKKIFCIEFEEEKYTVHENALTFISAVAEIISMNAFKATTNTYTVGLTLKIKDGSCEDYLLIIYCDWDIDKKINLTQEWSCFNSIPLKYIPYVLYYTDLPSAEQIETVWLLSGGDRRIHLFKSSGPENKFKEDFAIEDKFPELVRVQGITLHMDILYLDQRKTRMTVTSGEDGNVHLFRVDLSNTEDPAVVSSRLIQFDFPSSSVKFFYGSMKTSDIINLNFENEIEEKVDDGSKPLVAVATTLESCYVYRTDDMTSAGIQLPESENFDVVTSCIVCDVNFDGKNEIVLGTYGQVILIYKQASLDGHNWELMQTLSVPSPILALAYEDVLGDGVKELIVSTMTGVHIFQADPENVSALIIKRLRKLKT